MGDLSKNFSAWEFRCGCGCGFEEMDPTFIEQLQKLRDDYGDRITISSGARCAKHNARVGGDKFSEHLPDPITNRANGSDLAYEGSYQRRRMNMAAHAHFLRVGIAEKFIHVGNRQGKPQERTWLYPPREKK